MGPPTECKLVQITSSGLVYFINQGAIIALWCTVLMLWWTEAAPGWWCHLRKLLPCFHVEGPPRRSPLVFVLDCCKQVECAVVLHWANIFILPYLTVWLAKADACDVWWWSIMLDTTVGTLLLWVLLRCIAEPLLCRYTRSEAFGDYKGPGTKVCGKIVAKQLGLWIILVIVMKCLVVFSQVILSSYIFSLSKFGWSLQLEVLFVVTLTPAVMNAIQFLALDYIISCRRLPDPCGNPQDMEPARQDQSEDPNAKQNEFLKHMQTLDEQQYYGFADFPEGDRADVIKTFYAQASLRSETEEQPLQKLLMAQRKLVKVFNEKVDTGRGGAISQADFLELCARKKAFARFFVTDKAEEPDEDTRKRHFVEAFNNDLLRSSSSNIVAEPQAPKFQTPSQGQSRHTAPPLVCDLFHACVHGLYQLSCTDLMSRYHLDFRLVEFKHLHNFFHRKLGLLQERERTSLLEGLDELLRDDMENQVMQGEAGARRWSAHCTDLPKWGDVELKQEVDYDKKVAKQFQAGYRSPSEPHSDKPPANDTALSPWLCNEEAAQWVLRREDSSLCFPTNQRPRLLDNAPRMNDCVGPAVLWARLGVALSALAVFGMPWIAQWTMVCKGQGFADHVVPSWGFAKDLAILAAFVILSLKIQDNIMRYVILCQLHKTGSFKLHICDGCTIDFSRLPRCVGQLPFCSEQVPSYTKFCRIMKGLTFLNLLNTWTNAEVFGRVLTTVYVCTNQGSRITGLWKHIVKASFMIGWVDQSSDFLVLTSLAYALILLQPIFAVIVSLPCTYVDYNVGYPYDGHTGYSTPWDRAPTGTSHKAVVQTLSALVPYEAVHFQDSSYGIAEMSQRLARAEYFSEKKTEVARRVNDEKVCHHGSFVAHELIAYMRELQEQITRALAKLVLVGGVQDAVQTKLQIAFLSLDWNVRNELDPVFCLGIFFNLAGYFLSFFDVLDILNFATKYQQAKQKVANLLENQDLQYEQAIELRDRQLYVGRGLIFGIVFALAYVVFWVYLVFNFVMLFICSSHIWNLDLLDPANGCYDLPL